MISASDCRDLYRGVWSIFVYGVYRKKLGSSRERLPPAFERKVLKQSFMTELFFTPRHAGLDLHFMKDT